MADEYQVTRRGQPAADAPPAPRPPPARPEDPASARAEIEATRARMSETIDEIEDVLLRKKEEVRDRLDVMATVRERPLQTLGMIFGAALVLGFLTGGGGKKTELAPVALEEEDEDEEEEDEEAAEAWERAEMWEDRAHRLLRIARAQEAELDIHRARGESLRHRLRDRFARDSEDEDEDEEGDEEPNFFDRLRDAATERLSGIAGEVTHRMMRGA